MNGETKAFRVEVEVTMRRIYVIEAVDEDEAREFYIEGQLVDEEWHDDYVREIEQLEREHRS